MRDGLPNNPDSVSKARITEFLTRLENKCHELGFDIVGLVRLGPPDSANQFSTWLDAGRHGEMDYLKRGEQLRLDSRLPHPGSSHAIVVGMNYGGIPAGPIARYARGDDYHELMRDRLRELHPWLENELELTIDARPYVDSGPILERDLARKAGLGWFGKNCCLINRDNGSFFFIGALVVNIVLPETEPMIEEHCGSCTRCLDSCPTNALVAPRELDARLCISYLTIELKESIPQTLRQAIGENIYGCDICQDVCPWNKKFLRITREKAFLPRPFIADRSPNSVARDLLSMSSDEYKTVFRGSAMKRAKLNGLKRNAAVVLGNTGSANDCELLSESLINDEAIVRAHSAWALGQIGDKKTLDFLKQRAVLETELEVRAEIDAAIGVLEERL